MEITKAYDKLQELSKKATINTVLRFDFIYNGFKITAFYSAEEGANMQIMLGFSINEKTVYMPFYFCRQNTQITVNSYIVEKYDDIKIIFKKDSWSPTKFFSHFYNEVIFDNKPILCHKRDLKKVTNLYSKNGDKPYFCTLRRDNMSKTMKTKIKNIYPQSLQQKIFFLCNKEHLTLVFTDDLDKAKDITISLNTWETTH